MSLNVNDATEAQVAAAIEKALLPLAVPIEVEQREFDRYVHGAEHFGFVVTATLADGLRRRFIADWIDRFFPAPVTLDKVAGAFAKEISASLADAAVIAREVAEVRTAADAVFADPANLHLGLRLVDVTPKLCDVTFLDDRLYLTIEMTTYDDQLKVLPTFFETDGADDAGWSIDHWMPEQRMRHARAVALSDAGAVGVVDVVTLRVLETLGLTLRDAIERLGTHEKVFLPVSSGQGPTHLMIHRFDGIVTCELEQGRATRWENDTLTLYGAADLAWAGTAEAGQVMGRKPGGGLFKGLQMEEVNVTGNTALVRLVVPLLYYGEDGRTFGEAPRWALRNRHGRTVLGTDIPSMLEVGDDV